MKNILICFTLFSLSITLDAQELTKDKFNTMTLNGVTMDDLFIENIDWTFFKSKMGNPTSESVTNHDGEFNTKQFIYPGAIFTYSDYLGYYDFFKVIITSTNYTFVYDGLQIKVGNSLSSVATKFTQAYADKLDDWLFINHEFADITLRLYYNMSGVITKIELRQDYL